jgi:hypothetical protein
MAAINVVFVLMTTFVPGLLFVFVFILALSSALVSVLCDKKYFIIYAVVTAFICCLVNMSDTLFYIIPSLITGFVFGFCYDKKFPSILIILSLTIFQSLFTYLSIPLIEVWFGRNIVEDIAKIFSISDYKFLNYIEHMFVFIISFIQELVAYCIISSQLDKFISENESNKNHVLICSIINLVSLILMVLFGFVFPEISYVFLFISIVITLENSIKTLMLQNKFIYIEFGASILIGWFVFAAIHPYVPSNTSLLLLGIFTFLFLIIVFINNCLLKQKQKDKIN